MSKYINKDLINIYDFNKKSRSKKKILTYYNIEKVNSNSHIVRKNDNKLYEIRVSEYKEKDNSSKTFYQEIIDNCKVIEKLINEIERCGSINEKDTPKAYSHFQRLKKLLRIDKSKKGE